MAKSAKTTIAYDQVRAFIERKLSSQEKRAGGPKINALVLLEEQHRMVEDLFEEFESASQGKKQAIFNNIADALAAHGEIEEKIFYPSIFVEKTEEELREAVEEHLLIKRVIADLLSMSPEDEQFDSKVTVLKELVEHHVEEEEKDLFPMVRKLDEAALETLGEMMKTSFDALMKGEPRRQVPQETKEPAPLH